jgi:NAD(P)-dependent dehydrogenase (short-subunit alcohol dehydrogenase family)
MSESVFISGAAGNLGRAVCEKFLSQDVRVTAAVSPADDVNFISHENLHVISVDLSNESETEKSLDSILSGNGPYSFAVFTVGGFSMGGFPDTDLEDVHKMLRLNFETAFTASRIFFRHFKNQDNKGRIILIGARPGLDLHQAGETVAYGLSKSLIFGLADIINATGKKFGIDAAVLVPSIIDTPENREAMPDADYSKWVRPDHLAEYIYFLSTEAGRELRNVVQEVYGDS